MATSPRRDLQQTDLFIATASQTVFVLSETPVDSTDVKMSVNGHFERITEDYTVSGTTLTWLNNNFILEAGDRIEIHYLF